MKPRFGFVVVYVKDIAQSKRFHQDVLGLRLEREAPNYVQFEHFALAADERLSEGKEPELYWLVDDAEGAARELREKGVVDPTLVTKPFGKVVTVHDPEGGARFFLELARNRPSQAV